MSFLEENSLVSRIEYFFEYIKHFIAQLKKGVLSSRINHKQATKLLSKINKDSTDWLYFDFYTSCD